MGSKASSSPVPETPGLSLLPSGGNVMKQELVIPDKREK